MTTDNSPLAEKETSMNLLTGIRNMFRGHTEMKPTEEHVIDLDADPLILPSWFPKRSKVEIHQKGGLFKWDPRKVKLYFSPGQCNGWRHLTGNEVHEELEGEPVSNANLLDYLLAHPHLIPENWRSKGRICFWGTIYSHSDGRLYVRCLVWNEREHPWYDGQPPGWTDNYEDLENSGWCTVGRTYRYSESLTPRPAVLFAS
jgi:hypothetical protein